MNSFSFKNIVYSIIYVVFAFIVILLVNVAVTWLLDMCILPILSWFNRLTTFFKIFLLLIGGFGIFYSALSITRLLAVLFGGLIFNRLPHNGFTFIASLLLAILNAARMIIAVWMLPNVYNFWTVCEMIILSFFILSFCRIVLPLKVKENDAK